MHNAPRTIIALSFVLALHGVASLAQGQTAPLPGADQAPTTPAPVPAPVPAPTVPTPPVPAGAPAATPEGEPAQTPTEAPAAEACEVEPCPLPLPDSTAVPVTAPAPAPSSYPPTPYYPQPAPVEAVPADATQTSPEYAPGPVISGRPARLNSPGAREHDGFFLRLTIGAGAGFARYRESVDGQKTETVETGGLTGQFEVAVGGRVVGNLIVHGNVLVGGVGGANKTVSGVKDASNEISSSLGLLGGGLTYYFMPYNAYVSGMIGVGGMDETRDDQLSVESGTGFGGALMLGKEWWVGQRAEWGMGAALRGTILSAPVTIAGIESRMRGSQVTIAVSVTFN